MTKNGLFVEYCAKDFLDGVMLLDPWEELAYRRICDMIYASNNHLENDDHKLAWGTKTGKRWKSIKKSLLEKGKIQIVQNLIWNQKCSEMLAKSARNIEQKSAAGKASAAKRNNLTNNETHSTADTNDVEQAVEQAVTTSVPTATSTTQEPKNPVQISLPIGSSSSRQKRDDPKFAFETFNALAAEIGIPTATKLDKRRRDAIRRTLADIGGIDAWNQILDALRNSPFCRGQNDRGWRANLDFLLNPTKRQRLVEGGYGDDRKTELTPLRNGRSENAAAQTAGSGSVDPFEADVNLAAIRRDFDADIRKLQAWVRNPADWDANWWGPTPDSFRCRIAPDAFQAAGVAPPGPVKGGFDDRAVLLAKYGWKPP